ncbi:hypothetical protein ABKN59_007890 [Abortiporus biennis]
MDHPKGMVPFHHPPSNILNQELHHHHHHHHQQQLHRLNPGSGPYYPIPHHLQDIPLPAQRHQQQPHPYNNLPPVYPLDPRQPHHHLPPHLQHSNMLPPGHPHRSTTCVPSLIPHGMDPGQVDMRTFFPYQPNEVKHRKRTTRSQLKVLEDVYKYDTKPNASLRKKLAEELNMTPRGVQVWFQNRRAKTKSQAKKAGKNGVVVTANPNMRGNEHTGDSPSVSDREVSSPPAIAGKNNTSPPPANTDGISPLDASADDAVSVSSSSNTITEVTRDEEEDTKDEPEGDGLWTQPYPFGQPPAPPSSSGSSNSSNVTATAAANTSVSLPNTPEHVGGASPSLLNVPDANLLAQRRPSLPIIVSPPSQLDHIPGSLRGPHSLRNHSISGPAFDQHGRRRSVDFNASRLSAHPYAYLAQHVNSNVYGGPHNVRRGSMPHVFNQSYEQFIGQDDGTSSAPSGFGLGLTQIGRRPGLAQRLSMSASIPAQQRPYPQPLQQSNQFGPPRQVSVTELPTNNSPGSNESNMSNMNGFSSAVTPSSSSSSSNSSSPPPLNISGQRANYANIAISSRGIPEPIPGPLPSPNFSFGDAPTNLPPNSVRRSVSSRPSPRLVHRLYSRRSVGGEDPDTEDDGSAASSQYDSRSRFGSFASAAGSESSFTTSVSGGGYYTGSEKGATNGSGQQQQGGIGNEDRSPNPNGFDPDMRRGSCTSGQFLEMFSDMDVNGSPNGNGSSTGGSTPHPISISSSSPSEYPPSVQTSQGSPPTSVDPHRLSISGENELSYDSHVLMYPMGEYTQNSTHGNDEKYPPPPTFTDPFSGGTPENPSYDTNGDGVDGQYYLYAGVDGGGGGPLYGTGAIELSNMCVAANPSAMGEYPVGGGDDSYIQFS